MSNGVNLIQAQVMMSGRVQGVGFRWSTQRKAQELDLTGWVRNLWDGRVEAVFEGPETAVTAAVAWCHRGDPPAQVTNAEVTYHQAKGKFKHFKVKWS